MSGIFWPLTSRSIWTCHKPGLIGGVGIVVWACTAHADETIPKTAIQVRRAASCIRIFLARRSGHRVDLMKVLTNASKRQLRLEVSE